jgi:hypothetical protein
MSNYLSQEYRIVTPQSNINLPLMERVLDMRQGKYDANKALIDQTLATYADQLKGLRDIDNEYIATRLREVVDTVNQTGQVSDFSIGQNTDTILNSIRSVTKDPFVQSAVANRYAKMSFDSSVSEIKKKNPELYSDVNYQDALDQAGYDKYMRGEIKDLGALNYSNYIDVPKVLDEAVAKWAKDYGYRTEFEASDEGMYFVNAKKEVLTKDEILEFAKSRLTPDIINQMQINARASYGRMDDKSFVEIAEPVYKKQLEDINSEIATQKAKQSILTGEELEKNKQYISSLEAQKKQFDTKIASKKYDKNDMYTLYQNAVLNSIANSYDRDQIVDIDYDFTIGRLRQDAEETRLKAEKESTTTPGAGTAIPKPPDIPEEKPSNFNQLKQNFVESDVNLKNTLQKFDPVYKGLKTTKERNDYVKSLMKRDLSTNIKSGNPLSPEVVAAVNSHRQLYKAYSDNLIKINETIATTVETDYNDMLGAKNLNLDNLSRSMPNTVKALKSGKTFSQLSQEEKDIIRYERIANESRYGGHSSEQIEKFSTYINRLKGKYKNDKTFNEAIKNVSSEEVGGFWSNIGSLASNILSPISWFASATPKVIEGDFKGAETSFMNSFKSTTEKVKQDVRNNIDSFIDNPGLLGSIVFDTQDSNITEVDVAGDTKSGRDLSTSFKNAFVTLNKTIEEDSGKILPNLPQKTVFSFSKEDKEQKAMAIRLEQIAVENMKEGDPSPSESGNNFTIGYNALTDDYSITYDVKYKDKTTGRHSVSVPKTMLPEDLRQRYETSLSDWSTNPKNPFAELPKFNFEPAKNNEETKLLAENVRKQGIDPTFYKELYLKGVFGTPAERMNKVATAYPSILKDPAKKQEVQNILEATVTVESRLIEGQGFMLIPVIIYPDNTKEEITEVAIEISRFDPRYHLSNQLSLTTQAIDYKISQIVSR